MSDGAIAFLGFLIFMGWMGYLLFRALGFDDDKKK